MTIGSKFDKYYNLKPATRFQTDDDDDLILISLFIDLRRRHSLAGHFGYQPPFDFFYWEKLVMILIVNKTNQHNNK